MSTSAGWWSWTSRTCRSWTAMCEQLLTNPLIEDYEIQLRRSGAVRDQ